MRLPLATLVATLMLLLVTVTFASEQQIVQCDKEHAELQVWQNSCKKAKATRKSAKQLLQKYTTIFNTAVAELKEIVATLKTANKQEEAARAVKKAAQAELSKMEAKLGSNKCNKILPSNSAVCGQLLVQQEHAKSSYKQATADWERAHKILLLKEAQQIGTSKLKNDNDELRIKQEAVWKYEANNAKYHCGHYQELRARFFSTKYTIIRRNFGYKPFHISATFNEAQKICTNRRGNLISIHDKFENELSAKLCSDKRNVPIGALLDKASSTFKWLDGSKMDYTAWAKGEPNNVNKGEPFAEEYTSGSKTNQWNDIHQTTFGCFVCKFEIKKL